MLNSHKEALSKHNNKSLQNKIKVSNHFDENIKKVSSKNCKLNKYFSRVFLYVSEYGYILLISCLDLYEKSKK